MKIPLAKDGWKFLIFLGIITAVSYLYFSWLSLMPAGVLLFTAYFFRDPERELPKIEGGFLSPADGKVVEIAEVYEGDFIRDQALRISIFLSLFDVHINRAPVSGEVTFLHYKKGRFVAAMKAAASEVNEANSIGIVQGDLKVLVKQIAGVIARRIVCPLQLKDKITAGQRIGLIRFGSRTEIYLPPETEIWVKEGSKVKGGETILGVLK
ncbi:MAG: phosphatidylserine decarboxylase family protein [bacterium]